MTNGKSECRHCGNLLSHSLVDLGLSPLANSYVPMDAADGDAMYPLHARVCGECYLVQVDDVVPPEEIFCDEYAYFSSFSESWLAHAKSYAEASIERFDLGPESFVLEIASNDGYLLQYFAEGGVPVLGVEPSANTAKVAEERGIRTLVEFFGNDLARTLRKEGVSPDLICSANVLAHVPDIDDFVSGVATLLHGDAAYTVEFPHLLNLIEKAQFDTIYHEHFSYLSLLAVEKIFAANGLRVFDVETLSTHGGSLRVYACLEDASLVECIGVDLVRRAESAAGLDTIEGYTGFPQRVEKIRDDLLDFLRTAAADNKRVVAYGAAAKGNTLLNYAGIDSQLIPFVVDISPAKQNKLLPGSRIPVLPVEHVFDEPPDYVLILPWNLLDEISHQLRELRRTGTRLVTAIPSLEIHE